MAENKRTVLATTEDLRRMLLLLHATLVYGSSAIALTFVGGWVFVGVMSDIDVPVMLPLLAIAATAFTIVAWTTQEEIQQLGKPYRTTVDAPEASRPQP